MHRAGLRERFVATMRAELERLSPAPAGELVRT
jgi:hypothetical protein